MFTLGGNDKRPARANANDALGSSLLPIEAPLETSVRLQSLVWVNPLPSKTLEAPVTLPKPAGFDQ